LRNSILFSVVFDVLFIFLGIHQYFSHLSCLFVSLMMLPRSKISFRSFILRIDWFSDIKYYISFLSYPELSCSFFVRSSFSSSQFLITLHFDANKRSWMKQSQLGSKYIWSSLQSETTRKDETTFKCFLNTCLWCQLWIL
jgi:hypothetical protein